MLTANNNFANMTCLVIKPLLDFPAASEVWVQYPDNQPHWYELHDVDPARILTWLIQHDQYLFERQFTFEIAPQYDHATSTMSSIFGQVVEAPGLTYDREGRAIFTCIIKATETEHRHTSENADLPLYYVTAYGEVAELANALVPLDARVRIDGYTVAHQEPIDGTISRGECAGAIDAERISILDTVIIWRRS